MKSAVDGRRGYRHGPETSRFGRFMQLSKNPCLRGFPKSAKSTQISCVGVTETKGGMVVKESKKFANVICTVHAPLGKNYPEFPKSVM